MASVTLPKTLTANTPENVADLQSNLSALETGLNGLDQTNFASANLWPWTIDIDPFTTPATQTNWSTITVDAAQINGGYKKASASSAEIGWDVPLGAGTWVLSGIARATSLGDVLRAFIEGVQVWSVGLSTTANTGVGTASPFTVAATGKKRVLFTSSTGVTGLSAVRLIRTA